MDQVLTLTLLALIHNGAAYHGPPFDPHMGSLQPGQHHPLYFQGAGVPPHPGMSHPGLRHRRAAFPFPQHPATISHQRPRPTAPTASPFQPGAPFHPSAPVHPATLRHPSGLVHPRPPVHTTGPVHQVAPPLVASPHLERHRRAAPVLAGAPFQPQFPFMAMPALSPNAVRAQFPTPPPVQTSHWPTFQPSLSFGPNGGLMPQWVTQSRIQQSVQAKPVVPQNVLAKPVLPQVVQAKPTLPTKPTSPPAVNTAFNHPNNPSNQPFVAGLNPSLTTSKPKPGVTTAAPSVKTTTAPKPQKKMGFWGF